MQVCARCYWRNQQSRQRGCGRELNIGYRDWHRVNALWTICTAVRRGGVSRCRIDDASARLVQRQRHARFRWRSRYRRVCRRGHHIAAGNDENYNHRHAEKSGCQRRATHIQPSDRSAQALMLRLYGKPRPIGNDYERFSTIPSPIFNTVPSAACRGSTCLTTPTQAAFSAQPSALIMVQA